MNVLLILKKLSSVRDGWGDTVKDMILTARSFVDTALCSEAEKVFNEKDWVDIMENDGMGRFEDGERVEWVMDSIRRWVLLFYSTNSNILIINILHRP